MINPKPATIKEIFDLSYKFCVPNYQRDFTWGKDEAVELIDDLVNYMDSVEDRLFLGNIIFDISKKGEDIIYIVDGQQRITTVMLLLIACRTHARKINANDVSLLIQKKISFVDETTAESKGVRLISSESIKNVLEYISSSNWKGDFPDKLSGKSVKRQSNKLKPIYDFFISELESFDNKKLSMFLKSIYEAYVIRIDIENELEAFSIFERTNARGVDLEASDLLKNFLFANQVENIEEKWPQIVENSNGTLLRMLKYFYIAYNGHTTKSNLYRKTKSYARKIGADRLLADLYDFSRFFNVLKTASATEIRDYFYSIECDSLSADQDKYEKIYLAMQGLRLFNVSQIYPLAYSAVQCFKRCGMGKSSNEAKKIVYLFEQLEKYHFINNAICERIGNDVEKLYAEYSLKFKESKDFNSVIDALTSELKNKLADREEFTSRFKDISYSSSSIPLVVYIFDRINNYKRRPGERINLFNPDPKVLRKNHNIEHFFPKKPKDINKISQELKDAIDNVGNLLVISFSANSSLGNLMPAEKISKLETELSGKIENLSYVKKFIEDYRVLAEKWDDKVINNRGEKIAKEAYNTVWKF